MKKLKIKKLKSLKNLKPAPEFVNFNDADFMQRLLNASIEGSLLILRVGKKWRVFDRADFPAETPLPTNRMNMIRGHA